MNIKEVKSEGLSREYDVTISASDFSAAVEKKLKEIAKTVSMAGFRAGKVPFAMVKQKYYGNAMSETLDDMLRDGVNEVLKEKNLRPVFTPDVDLKKFEDGKDIEFKVSMDVMPEIKLKDFSQVKVEKVVADVAEEEVNKALEYMANSRRDSVKVEEDRATVKGDIAVIDFVGSIDGVEFAGGKGEAYPLEIGSNSFIPGYEDQLIGKKAGEVVNVKATFPENYHAKDLAGKEALFVTTIKEIRTVKKAEINDDFAKSMGEENLDKLKETIKSRIAQDYEGASKMKLKRVLLDALDKAYSFDVPAKLVDMEYESIVKQYENAKKNNQLDEDEKSKKEEDLLKEYKDIAVRRVKLGLLLAEVGNQAKVTVNQEDVNKAIMAEAQHYPMQAKAIFDFYLKNKEAIERLRTQVYEEKVIDYVLSKATISEKKVSVEELYNFDEKKSA
ncbi:MAG: trigger factor [Alphaproteobacteria bacterium]|nr:trigger factor [Alphaproteobacteria bacterium]MBP3687612.1 trigger factor [Alphaproteobacteria bacterium]